MLRTCCLLLRIQHPRTGREKKLVVKALNQDPLVPSLFLVEQVCNLLASYLPSFGRLQTCPTSILGTTEIHCHNSYGRSASPAHTTSSV